MAGDVEKLITAKMVLDSSGFNSSLQGVNSQLKLAQSEFKSAGAAVGAFGKDSASLKTVQEALSKQVELQSQKIAIYGQNIEKTNVKMQAGIQANEKLKVSITNANKAYDEAVKVYGKQSTEAQKAKQALSNLETEYTKNQSAIDSNAKSVNKYTTDVNKAKAELVTMQGQLSKTSAELEKSNNNWLKSGESLIKSSEKLKTIGASANAAGNSILMMTAPLVGVGLASIKFANDFEDSMAAVSTVADTTQISMNDLKEGIVNLSNDTGKSVSDLSAGLYDAISSGVKTAESIEFMGAATKAAVGGFTDTKTAVNGLTTVLNSYGLSAEEVTNVSNEMMVAQNLGKTTFGEMAQVMGNVTPTAAALGVTTKELFSSLAVLTANGIKTSEAVTGLKAAFSNIIKPTKEASDAAKALGMQFDANTVKSKGWLPFIQDVKEKLKEAAPEYAKTAEQVSNLNARQSELEKAGKKSTAEFTNNAKALTAAKGEMAGLEKASTGQLSAFATMFGSVEALNTVLTLTSDQGMSLYNTSMEQMGSGTNYIDDAFNKVNNTSGKNFAKTLNELKNAGIKFGEALTPVLGQVTSAIGGLTDKLSGMDEGTLKTIANVGLFTLGLGGTLKVVGGLASGVGGILGVMGKFNLAMGASEVAAAGVGTATTVATGAAGAGGVVGLGASLGGAAIAAAPFLLAGAAVVGVGYAIYKSMQTEATPAVNLFADGFVSASGKVAKSSADMASDTAYSTIKISDATEKAVGAYMKMDTDIEKALWNIKFNGGKITDETKVELTNKFASMGASIKQAMDTSYGEQYTSLETFFAKEGALTVEQKATALAQLGIDNEAKKQEVQGYLNEIELITKESVDKEGNITQEGQTRIYEIKKAMGAQAVEVMSASELEQKVIMDRLKDYSGQITNQQASDVIKNAETQRIKTVDEANKQYEQTVFAINNMSDEAIAATGKTREQLIADAEVQRKETISKADDMKNQTVNKILDMNKSIGDSVDLTTGAMIKNWQKFGQAVSDAIAVGISAIRDWNNQNVDNKTGTLTLTQYTTALTGKVSGGPMSGQPANWTGDSNFAGGFTTLHEKGYELYDLPKSTRIFNHEASEDLVLKTAEKVATKVAQSMLGSANGGGLVVQIENFNNARAQDTQAWAEELSFYMRQKSMGLGVV